MTPATRGPIRSFRDLIVWQRAMDLAVATYRLTSRLPPSERFGLSDQMRRAATSIPANIAEGTGRWSTRDYLRSLSIANGSLKELETHLALGLKLQFYEADQSLEPARIAEEVAKLLGALMRSLRNRSKDNTNS